jgi:hypothetical protein
MTEHKYNSPFKRVSVTESGGVKIKKLQENFDKFWRQVNRVADKCPEKYHAIKAMQEACMWLTRATALQNQTEFAENKTPNDGLLAKDLKPEQQDLSKVLEKYQSGDRIHIKNRPTIIYKKK